MGIYRLDFLTELHLIGLSINEGGERGVVITLIIPRPRIVKELGLTRLFCYTAIKLGRLGWYRKSWNVK